MPFNEPYLTTTSAARFLTDERGMPIATATLRKMRCIGGGPSFHRFGRRVLYSRTDLLNWALRRIGKPMASTSAGPSDARTSDDLS
jgi:hypothetical protein